MDGKTQRRLDHIDNQLGHIIALLHGLLEEKAKTDEQLTGYPIEYVDGEPTEQDNAKANGKGRV